MPEQILVIEEIEPPAAIIIHAWESQPSGELTGLDGYTSAGNSSEGACSYRLPVRNCTLPDAAGRHARYGV
jgi:hypothetical protein